MKNIFIITISTCLISNEVYAWGWSRSKARADGQRTGNSMGSQLSNNAQKNTSVNQTDNISIQESSVDNVNNGQKGQATAFIMQGALGVAAYKKLSVCGGSGFTAYSACISGGILLGMALQAKKSGNSFNSPIAASWNNVCQYSTGGCGAIPNPYKAAVDYNKNDEDIKKAQALAESNGISVDANSGVVKLSDGKQIDPNDPASMAAALGADGSSDIMNTVKNIEKDALKKVEQLQPSSLASSYGIGSGEILAGLGYEEASDVNQNGALGAQARLRKPAQVSGLTKNFNGEPVGVAGDNLFGIMSRRYRLKSNQKTFFGPEL